MRVAFSPDEFVESNEPEHLCPNCKVEMSIVEACANSDYFKGYQCLTCDYWEPCSARLRRGTALDKWLEALAMHGYLKIKVT